MHLRVLTALFAFFKLELQTKKWRSASAIAVDLDFHDAEGEHVEAPAAEAETLLSMADSGSLPGNLFHLTPRGARIVFVLAEPVTDTSTYKKIAEEAGRRVTSAIEGLGYRPGYEVDKPALLDLARFLFSPRAIVDGHTRSATVE